MAATTNSNRGLRLDDDALGETQPRVVTHRGLQYPGEVMVAETVNPDWVLPLDGDTSFRVVLYTVPRRVPAGQIRDPRIAMAVARLNDVPEFGGPLGSDVPGRFGDLVASLKSCELGGADLALEDAPYCGLCSLSLDEEVPRRQAERIIADLDAALREYNRRLSSEAVTRILTHPTREQLDRFIDLMRVSDLTELANVLDERVVEFLRGFVSDGRPGRDAAL